MSNLHTSITKAFEYLSNQSVEIPPDLMITARLKGISLKAGTPEGGVPEIKARYNKEIVQALTTYFEGGSTATPKNQFRGAMVEGFNSAFDTGWNDGGGVVPIEADALEWLRTQVNTEIGHIDGVFQQAKELRQEADFDFFPWVTARADSYAATLDSIYNAARMLAKKNQALTWHLGNTEKHCDKCKELNGQTHKALWYLNRDYIPRKPGAAMDCGGYHCDCRLKDKAGNEVTI